MKVAIYRAVTAVMASAVIGSAAGTMNVLAQGGHHGGGGSTSTAACSLSPATLGGPLIISGSGFAPGTSYVAQITWPTGGKGNVPVAADSSGDWFVSTYAWWAGTYTVDVTTTKDALMATCSETVT
jgi:hypothetical protein